MPQRSQPLPHCATQPFLRWAALLASLLAAALPAFAAFPAASLTPSHTSLLRQSFGARDAGFAYLDTDAQVYDSLGRGLLVPMHGNDDYEINPGVRFTAARPEAKLFVEQLANGYRAACGERLVVTSLVRPRSRQPWNSDPLSVHPTGMAVDLRISGVWSCRRWLERTLLDLENEGAIEAARERVVPHYHVVVFPIYAAGRNIGIAPPPAGFLLASEPGPGLIPDSPLETALPVAATPLAAPLPVPAMPVAAQAIVAVSRTSPAVQQRTTRRTSSIRRAATPRHTTTHAATTRRYRVRRGDTLWSIARTHGISVQAIRRTNRLPGDLKAGQVLAIPAR